MLMNVHLGQAQNCFVEKASTYSFHIKYQYNNKYKYKLIIIFS